jgi:hypothetical protein
LAETNKHRGMNAKVNHRAIVQRVQRRVTPSPKSVPILCPDSGENKAGNIDAGGQGTKGRRENR